MIDFKQYPISLIEMIRAKPIVSKFVNTTALNKCEGLSRLLDAQIYVKHENHSPSGSFKIRGAVNLMQHLKAAGVKGVITFSTGNLGLAVATAAAWFEINAVIVVPENNSPVKSRKMMDTGAEVIHAGSTIEEAAQVVEEFCAKHALYYVHPANEPHLLNGVGTEFLEIAEQLPDLDGVIVPISTGSEVASAVVTLKNIKPNIEVYGVQAENSPAAFESWKAGKVKQAENRTFAFGLAAGKAYQMPFNLYKNGLTDFVTLSEAEIYQGIALAGFYTQNLVEGAGGSSIMAALQLKEKIRKKKIVLCFSSCNASPHEIEMAYRLPMFKHGFLSLNASRKNSLLSVES